MGIKSDPGYDLWGDDCLNCFTAGKTPKRLYVTINGVQITQQWVEDYGEPVNGQFILNQTWPCKWEGGHSGAWVTVDYTGPYPILWAVTEKFYWYFKEEQTEGCPFFWINEYQGPGGLFMHGNAFVFIREQTNSPPSIKKTLDMLGEVPDKDTFAEGVVKDDGRGGIRIARFRDGTCCRIYF